MTTRTRRDALTRGRSPERPPSLISVVIPVRNERETLPSQLDALAGQSYRGAWEVVVADNGSTDGTPELALRWEDRLPELRVVDASRRRGINHARNVGAAAARGDFVVFCDGDDVATAHWLEAMADAARRSDLVGGQMDGDTLNHPATVTMRFPIHGESLPISLGFLPYAFGGNLGVRSNVLRALGGLNERYIGGCDEIEFCWRAQLAGYRLCLAPRAVMRYRYSTELRELARQAYGAGFGETRLYRDFRDKGLNRPSLRRRMREWRSLLRQSTDLFRSQQSRGVWIRCAAYWSGRAWGSVHHRVLFL
jgi:glycosyltransferase involved in cell wall biosynthesis